LKSHHFLLGIDLGTTYLKAILIDEEGKVITEARTQHETSNPKPDYYEQNPIVWWENLKNLLQRILRSVEANNIKGVSFSGQMHGLVLLDKEGAPLIPSITWEDKRAEEISLEMEKRLGWENIKNTLGNKPMPGFTLPKLLWIKRNLPRVYRKTFKVLLPKGFLRYKLTGNLSMELSDASSGLLVNVKNREWAEDIFKEINLDLDKLPKLYESTDVTGRVTDRAAKLPMISALSPRPRLLLGLVTSRPEQLGVELTRRESFLQLLELVDKFIQSQTTFTLSLKGGFTLFVMPSRING